MSIRRSGGDTRVSAMLAVDVILCRGVSMAFLLAYVPEVPFLWLVCGSFAAEDVVELPLSSGVCAAENGSIPAPESGFRHKLFLKGAVS